MITLATQLPRDWFTDNPPIPAFLLAVLLTWGGVTSL